MNANKLISTYYEAFNHDDKAKMLSLVHKDVIHDINQGQREFGIEAFSHFLDLMDLHYQETANEIVVMADDEKGRAAAEFMISGVYKQTAPGLPEARNQAYRIAVGAFFEIKDQKIARITNYYNLDNWIAQVR